MKVHCRVQRVIWYLSKKISIEYRTRRLMRSLICLIWHMTLPIRMFSVKQPDYFLLIAPLCPLQSYCDLWFWWCLSSFEKKAKYQIVDLCLMGPINCYQPDHQSFSVDIWFFFLNFSFSLSTVHGLVVRFILRKIWMACVSACPHRSMTLGVIKICFTFTLL